jgi:hypothetical protein
MQIDLFKPTMDFDAVTDDPNKRVYLEHLWDIAEDPWASPPERVAANKLVADICGYTKTTVDLKVEPKFKSLKDLYDGC